jgi:hypothetical protein
VAVPSLEKQKAVVELSNVLYQQQRTLEQLVRNGEQTMGVIASDLLASAENKQRNQF